MQSDTLIKCALVQMNSGDRWQDNLQQAIDYASQAVQQGARLIVFPENFLCFGQNAVSEFIPYVSHALSALQDVSDRLECVLVCGSVPVPANGNTPDLYVQHVGGETTSTNAKCFSRCLVLRPNEASSHYDKIHLFDVDVNDGVGAYRESERYCAGLTPVVCEVLGQTLGMSICYDLRFPELFQKYASLGVGLISAPSAFTCQTGSMHWEVLLRARAIETQSYVLAANQCGEHGKGRRTWGHSMIVAPSGEILSQCGHEPGIAYATLDFSILERLRSAMPLQAHKRLT